MGRLWPVGWARKSCKDRKKCPFLTSFAQQCILSAQGYFGNHHPLKKWYWKKFQLFFSLVETLECYVALISSEMLLLWMKTKVKPFGYLFGTHGRGCVLTSSCCSLAMAEMLNWWNHGSNGDEPYRNEIFFLQELLAVREWYLPCSMNWAHGATTGPFHLSAFSIPWVRGPLLFNVTTGWIMFTQYFALSVPVV